MHPHASLVHAGRCIRSARPIVVFRVKAMLSKRIVVVGGGISGLAAAHRLVEHGVEKSQITLVEASERLGGTLETQHRDGFLIERGPDSFISEKPEAVSLAKRLG